MTQSTNESWQVIMMEGNKLRKVYDQVMEDACAEHRALEKPSCLGRQLGCESCYHNCPVSSECYGVVCGCDITETEDCYYIHTGGGAVYRQRKGELSATERKLGADEEVIISLCETVISADKLLKNLRAKYST